jgi:hypothetical protein
MPDLNPSLYETLLQNFDGDLDLHQVNEADQHTLSVLDNLQRILNSRAGTLAHLVEAVRSTISSFPTPGPRPCVTGCNAWVTCRAPLPSRPCIR